jgi:hypothetical protein
MPKAVASSLTARPILPKPMIPVFTGLRVMSRVLGQPKATQSHLRIISFRKLEHWSQQCLHERLNVNNVVTGREHRCF